MQQKLEKTLKEADFQEDRPDDYKKVGELKYVLIVNFLLHVHIRENRMC